LNPREELAQIACELRTHAEWLIESGATGLPAVERPTAADPQPVAGRPSAPPIARVPAVAPSARATLTAPSVPPAASPSSRDPAVAKIRLIEMADEIRTCTKCVLHGARTQTVFARGNPAAELCFIGEGPGADEDRLGEPFVGKAGQLLDRMIGAMGYARDDVYVCNIVKCRPPDNRKPEPDEMASCKPYLREQLELVSPKVIVALGATAVEGLIGTGGGITRMRGQWKVYRTIPVMPTFHPAYLLRTPAAKREVWADLQTVLKQLGRPVPPAGRSV